MGHFCNMFFAPLCLCVFFCRIHRLKSEESELDNSGKSGNDNDNNIADNKKIVVLNMRVYKHLNSYPKIAKQRCRCV